MNPNIEEINEHTWAVNFTFLIAGYIKELNLSNINKLSEQHDIFLIPEGVLIINNQGRAYSLIKFMLPIIQLDSDYELHRKIKHIEKKLKMNTATDNDKIFALCLRWDYQRREVFKDRKKRR